jgi:hypothetical protein
MPGVGFTIGALSPGVAALLQGRTLYPNTLAEYARKTVLELSENYKFPLLQQDGPVVQLIPLQASYPTSFFLPPGAPAATEINTIESFFIFNSAYSPLTSVNSTNSGYNLVFSTIDDVEVLINIPGIPIKWTRHSNLFWFGSVPDAAYSIYARIKIENLFLNAGTGNANNDVIGMPNSWQDIIEYATAMRIARDLNLSAKASELYNALNGDSAFQKSGGIEGTPGLIFQRTSQESRDQGTALKSVRLRMGRQ